MQNINPVTGSYTRLKLTLLRLGLFYLKGHSDKGQTIFNVQSNSVKANMLGTGLFYLLYPLFIINVEVYVLKGDPTKVITFGNRNYSFIPSL